MKMKPLVFEYTEQGKNIIIYDRRGAKKTLCPRVQVSRKGRQLEDALNEGMIKILADRTERVEYELRNLDIEDDNPSHGIYYPNQK